MPAIVIPISLLTKLKLFGTKQGPKSLRLESGEMTIEVDETRSTIAISVKTEIDLFIVEVQFQFVQLSFGMRPYFISSSTGQMFLNLIIYKGKGYSRTEFLDARLGFSRREARALIQSGLQNVRRRKDRSRKRIIRKTSKRPELSILTALERGRGAVQDVWFQWYIEYPPSYHAEQTPPVDWTIPNSVDFLSRFPCLDLRALASRHPFQLGQTLATTLGWPADATADARLVMVIDLREQRFAQLMIGDLSASPGWVQWQRIQLVRNARGRWYAICPLRKSNCETLYLRNGVFASAKAQRLVHASQRS